MKPVTSFVENVLDIRPQERGRVLLMSTYLLLIIASYSTTKAVRDSLFVTKIGPGQLPYVYLLIAAAMGFVSLVYSRAVNRIGLKRLIRATSLIAISNLLVFWLVFKDNAAPWFYVLYVWVSLFGAITASQFWLLATHVFDPREARRVFSWIGIGGILGGIVGGGLTNRMAHWFGTESLLLVCALMMAGTIVILSRIGNVGSAEERAGLSPPALFRQVRESRQLSVMVVLLSVAVVVEAFIDYEYKLVANHSITSKDHLTAFFGSITFGIGILSLAFQTLFAGRILKRFGVGWAIQLLPSGLLIAFLALAFRPGLWTAAALQLVDGAFSYSIHRSGMELLYLPIPPGIRNAVKGFIDTFVDRAGRAGGAVLLLIFTGGIALSITSLSFVAAGLVVVWIAMGLIVKRQYMHSFRLALEKKTIEPEELPLRDVDGQTMSTLLSRLAGNDDREVLYTLDLLSNTHPGRWRDHVNLLIHHRSNAVRARTVAVLASWNDPAIAREEFINHPDYEIARIATASALRLNWNDRTAKRELLNRLVRDPSAVVAREAMMTAGIVGHTEAVSFLIESLAKKSVRPAARQALLRMANVAVPQLIRRLADPDENIAMRRRIPKALALTGRQDAADALMRYLHRLGYRLDYSVLKALNRLRVGGPALVFDRDLVANAIGSERKGHDDLRGVQACLVTNRIKDEKFALLLRAIEERMDERVDRIFRLLALVYSAQDIYAVFYNYRMKPNLRPAAIEFLDNILEQDLKGTVLPLLESTVEVPSPQFISVSAAVHMLASSDDPWLSAIAKEFQVQSGEESHETRERRVITSR